MFSHSHTTEQHSQANEHSTGKLEVIPGILCHSDKKEAQLQTVGSASSAVCFQGCLASLHARSKH